MTASRGWENRRKTLHTEGIDVIEEVNDIEVAILAGEQMAQLSDRISLIDTPGGKVPLKLERGTQGEATVSVFDDLVEHLDSRAHRPRRRKGMSHHREVESFINYVNRYKNTDSVCWAITEDRSIICVFNYHPEGGDLDCDEHEAAGWADHSALYEMTYSEEWMLWCKHDKSLMSLEVFSELIEDNFDDLMDPVEGEDYSLKSEVLQFAKHVEINQKNAYEQKRDRKTGDRVLVCKEETSATTEIPTKFKLGIPVFEAGELYHVEARIRVRIRDGRVALGYELYRPATIVRDALLSVRQQVSAATKLPLFVGTKER